ncbi:asparaginase [Actinotalea sp.]|uniref:asparaginase n=1 Tax=Actinotalea sp. TaxID=1872145 RepID=UPI003569157F
MTAAVPLAVVERSGLVESVHLGHLLVRSASGDVLALGEVDEPMWPRSAVKPIQAVAMLRAGLRIGQDRLALAASSHEGTALHLDLVRGVLAEAGLDEADLQNTPDLPLGQDAAFAWRAAGHGPSSLTQNCSGKHAAMLATCVLAGWDTRTYRDPEHPLQRVIRRTLEDLTGVPVSQVGVDGCGAPLFSTTLRGLARAFSRIATAGPGTHEHTVARAVATHPHLVGGPHRDVSAILAAVPGLVAKDGAEGVFAAALPDGSALALKVADGSGRPVRAVVAEALARLLPAEHHAPLREMGRTVVLGHGEAVGAVRALLPAPPVEVVTR